VSNWTQICGQGKLIGKSLSGSDGSVRFGQTWFVGGPDGDLLEWVDGCNFSHGLLLSPCERSTRHILNISCIVYEHTHTSGERDMYGSG